MVHRAKNVAKRNSKGYFTNIAKTTTWSRGKSVWERPKMAVSLRNICRHLNYKMIIMYSAAQSIMSTATASVCATKVGKLDALQNDVHFLSAVFFVFNVLFVFCIFRNNAENKKEGTCIVFCLVLLLCSKVCKNLKSVTKMLQGMYTANVRQCSCMQIHMKEA